MVEVIPKHIKDVWDRWNIRGAVILSLTLQAILICFSPLRKRTPKRLLIILIWSSYLLADWSANFAVGLISKNQGKESKPDDPPQDKKLMALWAPFLLLHLGGPDTITAFALEDNALWLRHVFGLVFQAIAGVYVVLLSLPNSLWVIIVLVFVSGTIKYIERTMALNSASLDKFRDSMIQAPDPGTNYSKLMEEYKAKKDARLPTKIIFIDESDKEHKPSKLVHPSLVALKERRELHDLEIVQYAYKFFSTFKGLVVNLIFSFRERDESLGIFENLSDPEEALRIIEVELGFLYDALFTKTAILHTVTGAISRVVAFVTLVAAFILFHLKPNKGREFHGTDVVVTYTLFTVGIALDIISIFLFMFSDWTCAALSSLKENPDEALSVKDRYFNWLLSLKRLRWMRQNCHIEVEQTSNKVFAHDVLTTPFFLRRWRGSINQFNFIAYATNVPVYRVHGTKGRLWGTIITLYTQLILTIASLCRGIAKLIYGAHKWISHRVNETSRKHPWARRTVFPFYFGFLSRIPHFFKSMWVLISKFLDISYMLGKMHRTLFVYREPLMREMWEFIFTELKTKSKFGDNTAKKISLLRGEWPLRDNLPESAEHAKLVHYVTNVDYDQSLLMWHIATELCYYEEEDIIAEDDEKTKYHSCREFSRVLSDYMMYLLIMQPGLMSEVAGISKIRFRDTLAETGKFFHRKHIENSRNLKVVSKTILEVRSDIDPADVKGDRSKSVLFDASRLAKDLLQIEKKHGISKWEILSKVWVELLSYAACHCNSTAHVEQLSRGSELINFVWLLMVHFGLTDQFQINEGSAIAKLIIGK